MNTSRVQLPFSVNSLHFTLHYALTARAWLRQLLLHLTPLLCGVIVFAAIASPSTAHAQSTCNDGAFYVGPCNGAVSVSAGSTGTIYFGVQNDLSYPM